MAETPKHYVRVNEQLWRKAKAKAARDGTTLSKLVRDMLEGYADDVPVDVELQHTIAQLNRLLRRLKG